MIICTSISVIFLTFSKVMVAIADIRRLPVISLYHLGYDGWYLRRFSQNTCRSKLTTTAETIVTLDIDNMHMKGHTDQWCRSACNP